MGNQAKLDLHDKYYTDDADKACEIVVLQYGAMHNGNEKAGGFLPLIVDNGKVVGNTWSERRSEIFHDCRDAVEAAFLLVQSRISRWYDCPGSVMVQLSQLDSPVTLKKTPGWACYQSL